MALTHDDKDANTPVMDAFMNQLEARADRMREQKASEITAGKEGEEIIAQWKAHGVTVTIRPDDPQNILRISVGGGNNTPLPLNYCVIRGDVGQCIDLLERAIIALRESSDHA